MQQDKPFVMPKETIQCKYDEFAPTWKHQTFLNDLLFSVGRLRRQLLRRASGKMLDVACGTGENFPFLRSDDVTAIDLSPGMLEEARKRAERLGRNVKLRVMDAEGLALPDHTFDTVVSALSTCTFPDPVRALQEMARVCKPEGRILLLEHGRSRYAFLARWQDRRAHKHFELAGCRWNQEPAELVTRAGLTLVSDRRAFLGIFHALEVRPI